MLPEDLRAGNRAQGPFLFVDDHESTVISDTVDPGSPTTNEALPSPL
jgi:hypothetical protein